MTLHATAALARASLIALAVALAAPPALGAELATVSPDQLEQMLGQPGVRVLDANAHDVYVKAHVPGAVWIDYRAPGPALPQDHAARLVFYCKNPH